MVLCHVQVALIEKWGEHLKSSSAMQMPTDVFEAKEHMSIVRLVMSNPLDQCNPCLRFLQMQTERTDDSLWTRRGGSIFMCSKKLIAQSRREAKKKDRACVLIAQDMAQPISQSSTYCRHVFVSRASNYPSGMAVTLCRSPRHLLVIVVER